MASGDPVLSVLEVLPTATAFATRDTIPGASSPAESIAVYDFPAGATAYLDLLCKLAGYGGGGLVLMLPWTAGVAGNSGGVRWEAAVRRLQDGVTNIGAAHTYSYSGVTTPALATNTIIRYSAITIAAGGMDGWSDGEAGIVRVRRLHDDAGDTMLDNAELWGVYGVEG